MLAPTTARDVDRSKLEAVDRVPDEVADTADRWRKKAKVQLNRHGRLRTRSVAVA
jgi:hypothetical protein